MVEPTNIAHQAEAVANEVYRALEGLEGSDTFIKFTGELGRLLTWAIRKSYADSTGQNIARSTVSALVDDLVPRIARYAARQQPLHFRHRPPNTVL